MGNDKNIVRLTESEMFSVNGGYDEAIVPAITTPLSSFDGPEASDEVAKELEDWEMIAKGLVPPMITEDE